MSVILLQNKFAHYEVLGRGRPLLFLHGWVGSWRYWVPAMQAASTGYRAYALDFWGFGESARAPERYSLEEQVYLLQGFMDQMGMLRIALLGHGMGALAALAFTKRNPDLVDRLMMVGYPLGEEGLNRKFIGDMRPNFTELLLGKTPLHDPVRQTADKADPEAALLALRGRGTSLWNDLKELETPCLLVHGQNDPMVNAPDNERLAELPDKSHSVLFDESGHFPMLDESNKFNRLMMDFLALKSGESIRQLQLKEEWVRRIR